MITQAKYNNVPANKLKIKRYKYYHLFSDGIDWHIDILSLGEDKAREQMLKMKADWQQKYANMRIYFVEEEEDYRDGEMIEIQNDCIFAQGNYPY